MFSRNGYRVELDSDVYSQDIGYALPLRVSGPTRFRILAIWATNNEKDRKLRYIGQVYAALRHYANWVNGDTVVAGDFNWNLKWDRDPDYPLLGKFEDVVKSLEEKSIHSAYHAIENHELGAEPDPTLFHLKQKDRPHHVDYVFAPES